MAQPPAQGQVQELPSGHHDRPIGSHDGGTLTFRCALDGGGPPPEAGDVASDLAVIKTLRCKPLKVCVLLEVAVWVEAGLDLTRAVGAGASMIICPSMRVSLTTGGGLPASEIGRIFHVTASARRRCRPRDPRRLPAVRPRPGLGRRAQGVRSRARDQTWVRVSVAASRASGASLREAW